MIRPTNRRPSAGTLAASVLLAFIALTSPARAQFEGERFVSGPRPTKTSTATPVNTSTASATATPANTVIPSPTATPANTFTPTPTATPAEAPKLRIRDAQVIEGNGAYRAILFTIEIDGPRIGTITGTFFTQDGTAVAGSDYVADHGDLSITPAESNFTLGIQIVGDRRREGTETFRLRLVNVVNAQVDDGIGLGTIFDDDTISGVPRPFRAGAVRDLASNTPELGALQGTANQSAETSAAVESGGGCAILPRGSSSASALPWFASVAVAFALVGRRRFDRVRDVALRRASRALVAALFAGSALAGCGDGSDGTPATVVSATGDIQLSVDRYRALLGEPNNGGTAGEQASGRREITWDGVPDNFSAPNFLPFDFFNQPNRARGSVYHTPGDGVQVSADSDNPSGAAVRFGNINPTYADEFQAFSQERLFSPIGSNVVDVTFFVAGEPTPALVTGFGAVYTDVDGGDSSFELFDANDVSLGKFEVPPNPGGFSFLGVVYPTPIVSRVRIAYGNSPLGPTESGTLDVAVMDDFLYGEPHRAE